MLEYMHLFRGAVWVGLGDVGLLEEVCNWVGFEASKPCAISSSFSVLPAYGSRCEPSACCTSHPGS